VRSFLLFAFVAFLIVVSVLYVFRHPIRARLRGRPPPTATAPQAPPEPPAGPVSNVAPRVRTLRHAPEAQRLLGDFVRECAAKGVEAVDELRTRLRDEPDVELEPRWTFENGRVRGFPSLRSAYIAALLEIPGPQARDALLEALATTASTDEAYQIVAGLHRRDEGGFTSAALDCAVKAGPGDAEVATEIVALAAKADPDGTAAEVISRSPRDSDGTDPALLAHALENLPTKQAVATGRTLLEDPRVTNQGKERYLRSLCDRGELEVFASLREIAETGSVDRELRVTMAYAAVGSRAFYIDQGQYNAAGAGAAGERAQIRERYLRRLEEVERLIDAAVPPGETSRTLIESLRSRIAEHRTRLQ